MAEALDVYRDWLGIGDTERPPGHYTLLRVKKFEDDPAKIRSHYRKLNAHVRKFATGEYADQSQQLLNSLAKAMLCLTDARRKAEYDASLGRRDSAPGRRRTLEEILIFRKVVDTSQLERARNYADAVGLEVRDALVQQKLAAADIVMQAYAESVGLPYIDLSDIGVDESLVPKMPAQLARQHSCAPVMVDEGQLLLVSPNVLRPEVEEEMRLRVGLPVRSVLCTPSGIHKLVDKYYPKEAAQAEMAGGQAAAGKNAAKEAESTEKPKGFFGRLFKK